MGEVLGKGCNVHLNQYLDWALAPRGVTIKRRNTSDKAMALRRAREKVLKLITSEIHSLPPVAQAVLRDIEDLLR